jgi:double-GTPase-like protein
MTATVGGTATCSRENCYAPDTGCVLGNVEHCEYLAAPVPEAATAPEQEVTQGQPLPWSGLALGLTDVFPVAALGRPHVVGVVGPAGSGKTTMLAAHWIAARRGLGTYSRSFAGSYTLMGWHQIARHLQWQPVGSGFPPHTSSSDNRSPALLHVAYSSTDDQVDGTRRRHVLLTDAPGEWFSRWAEEPALATGAQWVADHADAFLLLADGDALRGAERGQARVNYQSLAIRLHTAAFGRPVIPVLAKADVGVPGNILEAINKVNRKYFDTEALQVSAHDPKTFASIVEPVDQAIEATFRPRYASTGEPGAWVRQMAVQLRGARR